LIISDATGREILNRKLTGSALHALDLSDAQSGTYFYSFYIEGVFNDGGRFIIQK
jgi:hypothetical protein